MVNNLLKKLGKILNILKYHTYKIIPEYRTRANTLWSVRRYFCQQPRAL